MKKLFLLLFFMPFLHVNSQESSEYSIYKVVKKIGEVEIREYQPLLFASYVDNGSTNDQNSSFRVLADYIFGSNKKNEEIGMTSPVVIRLSNNNEMLFRMPEKYTKQTIPRPNNQNVKFVETNYTQKAIIQYSGYSNKQRESQKIEELKRILDKHDIRYNNYFELFVYDPPYKFFNRRNEISVNILK